MQITEDLDSFTALTTLRNLSRHLAPVAAELHAQPEPTAGAAEPLLAVVREIQRMMDAVVAEIAHASLSTSGGPSIDDALADGGTIPRHQVRSEIERSRVASCFPDAGAAYRAGAIPSANIDVLARLTSKLSDGETGALQQHDAALTKAAAKLGEESFRKRVRRVRDKVRAGGGTTAAEQVEADSFARITPTIERDGYRIAGSLDPLRGAAVNAALARETKHLADDPNLCLSMTGAQITAQAMHDLILRGDSTERTGVPRASVRLHVLCDRYTLASGPHPDSIAETFEALSIGTATLGRLCCDATMRRVDTSADNQVHVPRASRSPSEAPSCSLALATSRHQQSSRPDGTLDRVIQPPTPINLSRRNQHDLAA